MLVELIMMALVIAYVGVVALGHALLVAAIYRCLREDYVGGRRKATETRGEAMSGGAMPGGVNTPLPAR
jgi:hypothetical protein